MCIILRLACKNVSRIAVKISFYGVLNMAYMQLRHFQEMWSRDVHATHSSFYFTSVILYMHIIFIAQWLFGGNSEILHRCDVFERRQKLCKPDSILKQTRVTVFYRENMTSFLNYATATLRAFLCEATH